jgi:hypothetical protein
MGVTASALPQTTGTEEPSSSGITIVEDSACAAIAVGAAIMAIIAIIHTARNAIFIATSIINIH